MVDLSLFLFIALGAQAAWSTPVKARTAYSVKETHAVPKKWTPVDRAPGDHMLQLQIGLKQENFEELDRHLWEVSDPAHERYGQHLSAQEVHGLVKPSDETLDAVHEWLYDNGIERANYSPAKDWIHIYIDVESAERLLDTEYSVFEHEDGSSIIRTSQWSLPSHLHELIDTVQPTTSFMRTTPQKSDHILDAAPSYPLGYNTSSNSSIASVCTDFQVTIECFRTLYGTIDYVPQVPGISKVAFNNYMNETPIRPDIELFLSKYRPESAPTALTFNSIEIAGGPAASYQNLTAAQLKNGIGEEANLDAQTLLGMAYPIPLVSFSTGGSPPFIPDINTPTDTNEPYLTWVNYVTGLPDLPQVISSSYGDDEQTVPNAYAERVCKSFAQLGARGISLLVSAGDGGLGGETADDCISSSTNKTQFLPAFPAGCPYVTTVGATEHFEPEVVAWRPNGLGPDGKNHSFYTGGSGFSNYFPRPKYQDGVVDVYVDGLNGLYDGLYNSSGRGYPDISAQGLYFAFVWNQTFSSISGTSASCPLASSIIGLLNDALIADGKPTLGFLNPWLYSLGYKGFTDIVSGNTSSCGTEGFPVQRGWDALTGWGTPRFEVLREIAMNAK